MNKTINYENWKALEFAKPTPLERAYFSTILKPLKISSNSKILEIGFGSEDIYLFIHQHNLLKAPSRLLKRLFYILSEKFVRFTFLPLSKGILSSNLFIILKKENNV